MVRDEFYWVTTDEPHASRRKAMLEKYPQIKELFGHDPMTKYWVTLVAVFQIFLCYLFREASLFTLLLAGWSFGGAINHYLTLSIHEITHNLAFAKPIYNRWYSMLVANIPLGVPSSITFQKYHMDHHLYQGVDGVDMDIPSHLEGAVFKNSLFKFLWVVSQPWFYIFRPLFLKPKTPGKWEFINWTIQITFNVLICYFWGWRSLLYLLGSTFLGLGLNPFAGHFIAEHYVFLSGYETYSYYGPLNLFTLNVGYHNEHHDFPRIPGSRLAKVREIAPEFYQDLPYHTSWCKVIWDYIFDPSVGPYSRVKRQNSKSN